MYFFMTFKIIFRTFSTAIIIYTTVDIMDDIIFCIQLCKFINKNINLYVEAYTVYSNHIIILNNFIIWGKHRRLRHQHFRTFCVYQQTQTRQVK